MTAVISRTRSRHVWDSVMTGFGTKIDVPCFGSCIRWSVKQLVEPVFRDTFVL